jgi:hypothetical protein
LVGDRFVQWRGRRWAMTDLLRRHREDLVLKKAIGMMGLQVTLGCETSAGDWEAGVTAALAAGDSIVQEYVEPGRYEIEVSTADGGTRRREIFPVLSPCIYDGRPGGCWVRYHDSGKGGVIGASGFGATENVMLAARRIGGPGA